MKGNISFDSHLPDTLDCYSDVEYLAVVRQDGQVAVRARFETTEEIDFILAVLPYAIAQAVTGCAEKGQAPAVAMLICERIMENIADIANAAAAHPH